MPRRLLDRLKPDSIGEFRAAARQRFDDGLVEEAAARPTAAIYLWGYAAEMTLKAAYFAAIGFTESQEITRGDLNQAVKFGISSMVSWPKEGQLHRIRAWAETLVVRRGSMAGTAYDHPEFGIEVVNRGQRLEHYWSESLRYHKNIAYPHEVRRVKEATEWLLVNSQQL